MERGFDGLFINHHTTSLPSVPREDKRPILAITQWPTIKMSRCFGGGDTVKFACGSLALKVLTLAQRRHRTSGAEKRTRTRTRRHRRLSMTGIPHLVYHFKILARPRQLSGK
ncbi:unnamed protein product [Soboliphyme baturini]|uniref:FMN_dh domain-containing protein n=1 Tax=Soboliphyme baturini TaxID=241478 RepID=A0A183ICK9_9BILA|nr:unnamed protein product [Soboliphyme baturini]